jgi:hypothetical protein
MFGACFPGGDGAGAERRRCVSNRSPHGLQRKSVRKSDASVRISHFRWHRDFAALEPRRDLRELNGAPLVLVRVRRLRRPNFVRGSTGMLTG